MSQVVEPYRWQVQLLDELGEAVGDPVWAQWSAVRGGEQRAVGISVPPFCMGSSPPPVPAQQSGGEVVPTGPAWFGSGMAARPLVLDKRCHDDGHSPDSRGTNGVQIIEVTDCGVRSAVIRLRRRGTALQFVLYPMIHMAKPAFYPAVTTRLKRANVVVAEGVGGGRRKRSMLFGALTLSYRVLRFNRRAQLVKQNIDYAALGVPVVHPDVSLEEFAAGWRRVPLAHRLTMWCVLPFIVVARLFGGTRMVWSRSMEQNDLPSPEEEDLADSSPELEAVFGGERDERLLAALCRLHEERSGESIEVAVVYGAAHMPAIVLGLRNRYGYRPRSADWLTIADL